MRIDAIISCILFLFQNVCCNEHYDTDRWVNPDGWGSLTTPPPNLEIGDSCQCPVPAEKEDQLALMYFRKFINSLFNRNKMLQNQVLGHFKRSLVFTLSTTQLDELQSMEDPRDLDILLTKILADAKDVNNFSREYAYTHKGMGVRALITDMFKDFVQLLKIPEMKFFMFVLLAIAIAWFIRRRYRISIILIVICGVFLYGYFHTYIECNRKLEVDSMIEVIESHAEESGNVVKSWFSRMFSSILGDTPLEKQKKKLIKSSKLNLPFCRPDHVFVMYTSDIFMKQIEILLEKITHSIVELNSRLCWPFNWIVPFAIVFLMGYILKLLFKYVISPKAWVEFMGRMRGSITDRGHPAALADGAAGGDRISGENLKMLLNVVNNSTVNLKQQITAPPLVVSGVQEVREALEAPTDTNDTSSTSSKSTSKERLNVSDSSTKAAQEAGFTIVDDDEQDNSS